MLFRKRLTRARLLEFFAAQSPCVVALEAYAGSHYWAREFGKLGHTVQLIPPAYVKPFVKRQKNDTADAEAICEAAQRPTMRFVPVKSEEQQASGVVFRTRDMLVHQRTQCINALRGHMAEYGHVFPVGVMHVGTLIARVEDPESDLPASARMVLQVLIGTLTALQGQIKELDVEINRRAKADPVAKRLMTIPGIGHPAGLHPGRACGLMVGLRRLAASRPQNAEAVTREAHVLRADICSIADRLRSGGLASIARINAAHAELPPQPALVMGVVWRGFDLRGDNLRQPLWPILWSLTAVLTSNDATRIGGCIATGCGWFFVDESPNHSRLWYSSEVCGNRERASRAYDKRKDRIK